MYLTCLQNLDQTAAFNAAVEKRDALLATQASGQAQPSEQLTGQQPISEIVETIPVGPNPVEQTSSVLTSSQRIAQQVTTRPVNPSIPHTPVVPKVVKTLASPGENGSDPIQVSIVERTSKFNSVISNPIYPTTFQARELGFLGWFVLWYW